jgi:hypothetical protein
MFSSSSLFVCSTREIQNTKCRRRLFEIVRREGQRGALVGACSCLRLQLIVVVGLVSTPNFSRKRPRRIHSHRQKILSHRRDSSHFSCQKNLTVINNAGSMFCFSLPFLTLTHVVTSGHKKGHQGLQVLRTRCK